MNSQCPYVVAFVTLAGALFFGSHWLLTPEQMGKADARIETVSAQFFEGRLGRKPGSAQLLRSDGTSVLISCGRVASMCARLKLAPIASLTVWLAPPVLGEQPWVIAAEQGGGQVLSEAEQRILFIEHRELNAYLSVGFIAISAAALLFANRRRSVVKYVA